MDGATGGDAENCAPPDLSEVVIGAHCDHPFPCPLRDQCWAFLPEHSVLDLYLVKTAGDMPEVTKCDFTHELAAP